MSCTHCISGCMALKREPPGLTWECINCGNYVYPGRGEGVIINCIGKIVNPHRHNKSDVVMVAALDFYERKG